ncbi:MAG: alpha-1,2-fucosyltransferase [Acidocella sp.]|nr:alpha-1,2-fucosyltransferase [Acidocella sp.]
MSVIKQEPQSIVSGTRDATVPPIIVTKIRFGLANQMFQYAAGRRLAYMTHGHLVLLLDDDFAHHNQREFGLTAFNISASVVTQKNVAQRLRAIFPAHSAPLPESLIEEKRYGDYFPQSGTGILAGRRDLLFRPEVLSWRRSLTLLGLWQDERYFSDIPDCIRHEFTLKAPPGARNAELMGRIAAAKSAFIHVRRGDYLAPSEINVLGVCSAGYYHYAAEVLRGRHGKDLKFFIFSDDPAWVRQEAIGGVGAEIIDWNSHTPAIDLMLMRACQHAVISNSTFSWWGAWLGERPGNTIIAPRVWAKALPEFQEIVPERWLRI